MQVPKYAAQESLADAPGVRQSSEVSADALLAPNQAAFASYAADAMQHANHAMTQIYSQQLQEANAARVADARNTTQTQLNDLLYGQHGALQRQGAAAFAPQADGSAAYAGVLAAYDAAVEQQSSALGNVAQRQEYAGWAADLRRQTAGLLQQHEGQQFRVYQRGVAQSALDVQRQTMSLNYNNPELLANSAQAMRQSAIDLARLEGYPDELGKAQADKLAGGALHGALSLAVQQGDETAATGILQQFSGLMTAEQLLDARRQLTRLSTDRLANTVASSVLASLEPQFSSGEYPRMRRLTLADDNITARWLHDRGETAANLAAKPWDAHLFAANSPQAKSYRRDLADAYLQQQLQDFNGDAAKAWAAFAAGPDAVQAAAQQAEAQGGNWQDSMPDAVRSYVQGNLQALDAGEGGLPRPTLAAAQSLALAHLPGNLDADSRSQVLTEVQRRFSLRLQQAREQDQQQRAQAINLLIDSHGDISKLPPALRNDLPARQRSALQQFAAGLAAGKPVDTDWRLYYRLQTDDSFLLRSHLPAFRDRLSAADYRQISNLQTALRQDETPAIRPERDVLYRYLQQAGINTQPKVNDYAGAQTLGRIWSAYAQRLAAARQGSGKPLSSEQINQVAAQLFTPVGVRQGWFGLTQKPAVLVDSRNDRVTPPPQDRQQIIQALQALYPGKPVTEEQVFNEYMRAKGFW